MELDTAAILRLMVEQEKRNPPRMPSTMQGYGIDDVEGSLSDEVSAVGRKAAVTGASIADPMSLSSATLGRISPQMRDDWRAYRASEPDADIVGQIIGSGGAYGGLVKALTGTLPRMVGSAGMVTGSDVIDGDVGNHTLAKALASQVGIAPMRAFLPMAAGAVASQVETVPKAQAQTKRNAAPAPAAPSAPVVDYYKMEEAAKDDPVLAGLLDTIKAKDVEGRSGVAGVNAKSSDDVRRRAAEEAAAARKKFFDRVGSLKDTGEADLKGKAKAAGQAVRDKAPVPFEELLPFKLPEWAGGGTVSVGGTIKNVQPMLPFILGGVAGRAIGKTPIPERYKTWRDALNTADDAAAAPSARTAAQQTARDAKAVMDDTTVMNTVVPRAVAGGVVGGALGPAGQAGPDYYDSKRLSTNTERDALVAEAEQYPKTHPERLRIEQMLADVNRYPVMHPAQQRAEERLGKSSTYINPAIAGGVAGLGAATLRAGLPFVNNDRQMMSARTDRMGQTTPKEVARESKRMDGIRDIDQSDAELRRQLALQGSIDDATLAQGQAAVVKARDNSSPELEALVQKAIEAQAMARIGQVQQKTLPPPDRVPLPATAANQPALPPPAVPPSVVAPPVGGQQAPAPVPVGPPPPPLPPAKSAVPSNAGQQPVSKSTAASGPRYTPDHSKMMEESFAATLKTKPGQSIQPNEKEAVRWAENAQKLFATKGMGVPSTENLVKRFMGSATVLKFLQSQGADITDPNVVRLAFRRGNETLSIGVGFGAAGAASSMYEDETSPTGYRDASGRFAKDATIDDAISKAMGGAP